MGAIVPFEASSAPVVSYHLTDEQIEATRAKYAALDATTPAGYEEVRQAIAVVRNTRIGVEKRRVDLKAEALDYGRRVDAEAKRLTALIESIENPLVAKKQAIDDEKARVKAEVEAKKLAEINAKLEAERAAEEARLKAQRDAEEARIAEERAKLAVEREALERERQEAETRRAEERTAEDARLADQRERERVARQAEDARLKADREAIDRERRELEAARQEAERVEFQRQAAIKAEADAKAKIEADRLAAAERDARIAELLPDAKKLNAYANALLSVQLPIVKSAAAKRRLSAAMVQLKAVADGLIDLEKVA